MAKGLPEQLQTATPTEKLLYLWLKEQGEVSMTQQAIADALFTERYVISTALKELRRLDLIEVTGVGYKKQITIQ